MAPAILVCLLLLTGCAPMSSPPTVTVLPEPTPSTTPTPPSGSPGTAPSQPVPADDPLPIEVAELGYTLLPDVSAGTVAYAAILRNPNTEWALQRAEVKVDLLDADGAFLAGADVVLTLLPGQSSAIAGLIVDEDAPAIASMAVHPPEDGSAFVPRAPSDESFGIVEVTTVPTNPGRLTTGSLVSAFATTQTFVQLVAVHRDGSGRLAGGATGAVETIQPGASVAFEINDSTAYPDVASTDVWWQLTR